MTNKRLAVTYSRVSSARQEQEETIKTQLSELAVFAAKNNLQILHEYKDEGWSGDILARPELDKLRQDVKRKLWDCVLIYDPDRLARRYSYQELILDELNEAGVEVMFVTTPAPKTSEDKILSGVRGIFAEYERMKIAERCRLGRIRRAKEGNIQVARPLYGYDYISGKGSKPAYYVVNKAEAEIVRNIFSWVAYEGLTVRRVCKRLFDLNIEPKYSKRGVWGTSTIYQMLSNTTYIGKGYFGMRTFIVPTKPLNNERYKKIKKSSSKKRPRSEWIEIATPVIISKELFEKAHEQLRRNASLSKRNAKRDYLLTGIIWCLCSHRRYGAVIGGGYAYYHCSEKRHSYPLPATCTQRMVNSQVADMKVWDLVYRLLTSHNLLSEQIDNWNMRCENAEGTASKKAKILKEIDKCGQMIDRYTTAYAKGFLTLEKLEGNVGSLKSRIVTLKQELHSVENKPVVKAYSQEEIGNFCRLTKSLLNNLSFSEKRSIVLKVVERVVAVPGELNITGHIEIPEEYAKSDFESIYLCSNHNSDANTITKEGYAIPFKVTVTLKKRRKNLW